jgi:hypothetical protein
VHDAQMDIDDGNSGNGHNMEGRDDGPRYTDGSQGQGNQVDFNIPSQPHGTLNNGKQVDGSAARDTVMKETHAVVTGIDEVDTAYKTGNSMNLNHNMSVHSDCIPVVSNSEQTFYAECVDGEISGMDVSKRPSGPQPATVGGDA